MDSEVIIILAGGRTDLDKGLYRAQQVINDAKDSNDNIYLPAPAFAECCHMDAPILARLRIPPLNVRAAKISSDIFFAMRGAPRVSGQSRQAMKVDAMILGTAEAIGSEILYVGSDGWFESAAVAAKLRVKVRRLPELRMTPRALPLEYAETDSSLRLIKEASEDGED